MPLLLTSESSIHYKFIFQTNKYQLNVWQNPNDPDDENEHFKQPHIATQKYSI